MPPSQLVLYHSDDLFHECAKFDKSDKKPPSANSPSHIWSTETMSIGVFPAIEVRICFLVSAYGNILESIFIVISGCFSLNFTSAFANKVSHLSFGSATIAVKVTCLPC